MKTFLEKLGEALLASVERIPKYEVNEEELKILLSKLPLHSKLLLQSATLLISLLPLLRKRPQRFSSMSIEERVKYLEKLSRSRVGIVRNFFLVTKFLALLLHCEKEEVKRALGCLVTVPSRRISVVEIAEGAIVEFDRDVGELTLKCDVAVIGSGAGGAVVAKELAQKGFKVLIIEEGFMPTLTGNAFDSIVSVYRSAGFTFTLPTSFSQPFILLPSGSCVGGTTVINEGTCFRAPDSVIEKWNRDLGLDIDLHEMHKYFDEIERTLNVHPVSMQLMGRGGVRIALACEKLGYSYFPLRKCMSRCEALGLCVYGCPIGAKMAMSITYIPLATKFGARVYTGMKVKDIDFKGRRITKVGGDVLDRAGRVLGRFSVEARYFALCAGAIQTPYLLLKNGIANSSGLVGKNLRIHPCFALVGIFDEKLDGWKAISQSLAIDEFLEEGILFQVTFLPLSVALANNYLVDLSEVVSAWDKVAILGVMLSDEDSKGSVKVLAGKPLIFYSLGKRDLIKAQKALVEGCKILFAAGARKIITPAYNFPVVKDLSEVRSIVPSGFIWSAYHPQGTCRMSKNPLTGVVDPYGRAHDFENLYIADASIFPSSVMVNPMLTIMVFAMRVANRIAEVGRCSTS